MYKEHARENLLPAAWVAVNRGADSVPTLGAGPHHSYASVGGRERTFSQHLSHFGGIGEGSCLGNKDFVKQRTQQQSHALLRQQ